MNNRPVNQTRNPITTALLAIVLSLIGCGLQQQETLVRQDCIEVAASKLGKEIKVIGPLGIPLDEIVEVRGTFRRWPYSYTGPAAKGDDFENWVRLTEMSGRPLKE